MNKIALIGKKWQTPLSHVRDTYGVTSSIYADLTLDLLKMTNYQAVIARLISSYSHKGVATSLVEGRQSKVEGVSTTLFKRHNTKVPPEIVSRFTSKALFNFYIQSASFLRT